MSRCEGPIRAVLNPCGCSYGYNAYNPFAITYCQVHSTAPKLLKACKKALRDIRDEETDGFGTTIEALEAAISEAEGRS